MKISEKSNIKRIVEVLQAVLEGKTLQYLGSDGWQDQESFDNINWLCGDKCRIKPTPKTVPLSLETWPPGLVQVRGKETGNLFLVREVTRTGVRLSNSTHVTTFSDFALCYTHPDGRPLTIEVDG